MKKIPTLLVRDPDDRAHVLDDITPGCEWVLAGEGVPTRKYDGTCVMFDGSTWWARREVKPGRATPLGFREEQHDDVTGKTVGWEPMMSSPFSKYWAEAVDLYGRLRWAPGTYELVGPKINGNPEHAPGHQLVRHGATVFAMLDGGAPLTVDRILDLVRAAGDVGIEGVVWHHPDGRMAKLKARDLRPQSVNSGAE